MLKRIPRGTKAGGVVCSDAVCELVRKVMEAGEGDHSDHEGVPDGSEGEPRTMAMDDGKFDAKEEQGEDVPGKLTIATDEDECNENRGVPGAGKGDHSEGKDMPDGMEHKPNEADVTYASEGDGAEDEDESSAGDINEDEDNGEGSLPAAHEGIANEHGDVLAMAESTEQAAKEQQPVAMAAGETRAEADQEIPVFDDDDDTFLGIELRRAHHHHHNDAAGMTLNAEPADLPVQVDRNDEFARLLGIRLLS